MSTPTGTELTVVGDGPRCRTANAVMRGYFRRLARGSCAGSGCPKRVRSYRCSAASATTFRRERRAATCAAGHRVIYAARLPDHGPG